MKLLSFQFIIVFCFCYTCCIKATTIDSLESLIPKYQALDSAQRVIDIYLSIGEEQVKNQAFELAFESYKKALNISEKHKYKSQQFKIWLVMGQTAFQQQDYEQAIQYFTKITKRNTKDEEGLTHKAYRYLSQCHQQFGDIKLAYEYIYEALQGSEIANDLDEVMLNKFEIAALFYYKQNYELSIEHFEAALQLARQLENKDYILFCIGSIGATYLRIKKPVEAMPYNLEAYNLSKDTPPSSSLGYILANLGNNYFDLGRPQKALPYFQEALKIKRTIGDKMAESGSLRMLGVIYVKLDQFNKGLSYLTTSLEVARSIHARDRVLDTYREFANAYKHIGNYKDEAYYLEKYISLKDSITNEETIKKIENVTTKYEVRQRDQAIVEKNAQIEMIYRSLLIGGIIVLLMLSWLLYSRYRNQVKTNQLLSQKNEQIQEKNQKLMAANEQQLASNQLLLEKNKKIQLQNRKLEVSNQELQRFAYIASHDLKEPLRNIGSYSSLIKRRYYKQLDNDGKEFLSFITTGVSRMYNLLNDVLKYAKIEMDYDVATCTDAQLVVENVLLSMHKKIEEQNAEVTIQSLPKVEISTTHLTQLFQNLISNGIKYCDKPTPKVTVSCHTNGEEEIFAISDNGIGMNMKYKDKIFDMFLRLHNKDEYEGTGVGLAICKKIVAQYGGEIWVESKEGEGSTFYFSLPTLQTPMQEAMAA